MLMLLLWIVTGLVVLAVLGSVLFGVAGSLRRLGRELAELDGELEPLRTQARATAARAAEVRDRPSSTG